MLPSRPLLVSMLLAPALLGQSNAVPGTDVNLYDVSASTVYGRRGPAYPGGEVGIGFGHAFCNAGTVHVPWQTSPTTSGLMTDVHFKIAFLVARDSGGRMVQVSTPGSYVKHSRVTYNLGSSQCGTCQSGPSSTFRIGCYDAYGTGFNGDRFNLGPPTEIDPWLGSWNPVGSYFDRGDPVVAGAAANDGTQSLTSSQTSAFDVVKNRITIPESELVQAGTFYGQVHLVCEGEPVANRGNNQRSAQLTFSWNGSSWSSSNVGNEAAGSVLTRWNGATWDVAGNGTDDGRFVVAVKVTGPVAGVYHYEYAVHNVDNARGGASLRIPLDATATLTNVGFRDPDTDALNQWTWSRNGGELAFAASATNALEWNNVFNFWFDCSAAPSLGNVTIDQARIGPGQLAVAVQSEVPSGIPTARVSSVGSSCGDCDNTFYESFATAAAMDLSGSSMTLAYNAGRYSVGAGTTPFVAPTGTPLTIGGDSEVVVPLPFPLPYPGGSTTQLRVCSNGFISPAATNGTAWTPSVAAFLSGQPRWAAAWHDYTPNTTTGRIVVDSSPSEVRVTWNNVPNFGGASSSTFQYRFQPNGTVDMIWQSMSPTGNPYLVGWTPGGGAADPGNTDLSAALPTGFTICAGSVTGITLATSARPILGTTIQLVTSGIQPGTAFGLDVLSFVQALPPVDLSSFGMPGCEAHTQGGVNQFFLAPGASVQLPFAIPADNGLTGLVVVAQSYAYTPPMTPLGLIASNGIVMVLGPQ